MGVKKKKTPSKAKTPMLVELLDRAVWFWRTGQNAFGATSWLAYEKYRIITLAEETDVTTALMIGDNLRAADVAEYGVLPIVRKLKNNQREVEQPPTP